MGARWYWRFAPGWYATFHGDVGTRDSDATWQVLGAVVYRFDHLDAVLGYRYLDWEFDDEPVEDLNLSGIFAGVKFLL